MKSIIYLSFMWDLPCKPIVVEHDPRFPAYEHYKYHDSRYTGRLYSWKYVCTIESGMGIHEKINRRAEHISRTASVRYYHGRVPHPDWTDKRPVGRDYQWFTTPQRIAKSRFRHWKRMEKTRRGSTWARGYCCIDFSFGLTGRGALSLNSWERRVLLDRLELAASSRSPLPPWSLNSAVDALLASEKAA